MIFVIDDDAVMANCVKRACGEQEVMIFGDGISAMNAIDNKKMPGLIFLDIFLSGPDGFTFLNELVSYSDTAKIPVVVITSLDLGTKDLSEYGVVGILSKETMTPQEIFDYAKKYC